MIEEAPKNKGIVIVKIVHPDKVVYEKRRVNNTGLSPEDNLPIVGPNGESYSPDQLSKTRPEESRKEQKSYDRGNYNADLTEPKD